MRGPALRFAPEIFREEILAWMNFGEVPDDELLCGILANDLMKVFAFAPHNWSLIHATLVWLLNFAPRGSHGSPELIATWEQQGGLAGRRKAS